MANTFPKQVYYSENNVGCKTPCACCGEPFKPSIGSEVPFDPVTRMPVCWDCSETCEEVTDPFNTTSEVNINIDMEKVAERILNNYSGSVQPNGAPIKITRETRLYRFAIFEDGEMVEPDKVHILVDGGGGFTAHIDPDTAIVVKRDGNLSEFAEAISELTQHQRDPQP